ncbi:GntR family transcriptional regulator [Allokutzneria multivorans]|uniref:GntR family transcriptional regulator n=1 Tax=Allokutzneria multivorans TaxID=1142134 RepID=A0ABP7RR71_9PSEU
MADPGSAYRVKFRGIADELRAAILAGKYPPGSRLPGENDLMERYGAARMTVRAALDVLKNEGLAWSRRGSGVYVRDDRLIRRLPPQRVRSDAQDVCAPRWKTDPSSLSLTIDSVDVTEQETPEHVARVLGVPSQSRVWVRKRRNLVDGRPVMLCVSYFPARLAVGTPLTKINPGPGGVYARLRELGKPAMVFREEIRARMPQGDEVTALQLEPGTPLMVVARTALTGNGEPVELTEMTMDAGSYVLEYEFPAQP